MFSRLPQLVGEVVIVEPKVVAVILGHCGVPGSAGAALYARSWRIRRGQHSDMAGESATEPRRPRRCSTRSCIHIQFCAWSTWCSTDASTPATSCSHRARAANMWGICWPKVGADSSPGSDSSSGPNRVRCGVHAQFALRASRESGWQMGTHRSGVICRRRTAEIALRFDRRAWQRLQKTLLGKTLIFTDNADWSDAEIVRGYRAQHHVENAFRHMKNPHYIALRPQHHWTDQDSYVHGCLTEWGAYAVYEANVCLVGV